MSASLVNVTTASAYTKANRLDCPKSARVRLQIFNAAIFWQVGRGIGQPEFSRPEEWLAPGLYSFDEVLDAVQVRSAVAGAPAQVSIATRTAREIGDE